MKYPYQVVFEDEYLNLFEVGWYENLDDAIDDINGFIWEDAFKLQKGDLSVYPSTFGFAFDTCIYDIALTRHDEEEHKFSFEQVEQETYVKYIDTLNKIFRNEVE